MNDHMLENNASCFLILFCFVCLQFIPMPVLYGVFLYMGASSLKGIQVNYFTLTGVPVVTSSTDVSHVTAAVI